MSDANQIRVAWLLPSTWFYWQPVLSKFARVFPQTKLFTTRWTGFAKGFENAFAVQEVGQKQFVTTAQTAATGYGRGFTYLSPAIVQHLFQFKPEVIFTNSFGIWTVLALLFKPLGGWRVVIAYEGSSPNVDYRHSPSRLAIRRMMVRAADAFITNSQAGKAYLLEVLGAAGDRIFAQPYEVPVPEALLGVPSEHEKEDTPKESDSKVDEVSNQTSIAPDTSHPIFLYVGKIVPRKGLHLLLEACKRLQQQGYQNFTVQLIGNGDQRAELEAFCQQHHLQERVQWVGRVEYHRLGQYFRQADAFILPTLEDTWGLVVLEAMLFACPILCSKWAGAADLVVHGQNGYVFDARDPEEIAVAMRRILDDPDAVPRLGKMAQETIAQYTPEAAATLLVQITTMLVTQD